MWFPAKPTGVKKTTRSALLNVIFIISAPWTKYIYLVCKKFWKIYFIASIRRDGSWNSEDYITIFWLGSGGVVKTGLLPVCMKCGLGLRQKVRRVHSTYIILKGIEHHAASRAHYTSKKYIAFQQRFSPQNHNNAPVSFELNIQWIQGQCPFSPNKVL